jgi:hypothetical protein
MAIQLFIKTIQESLDRGQDNRNIRVNRYIHMDVEIVKITIKKYIE